MGKVGERRDSGWWGPEGMETVPVLCELALIMLQS